MTMMMGYGRRTISLITSRIRVSSGSPFAINKFGITSRVHSRKFNFKVTEFDEMSSKSMEIPVAKKVEHYNVYHGEKVLDQYHWLRDDSREDKEVLGHLAEENEYSEALLEPLSELSSELYKEMVGRIAEDDASYPITRGPYQYYSRTVKDMQYPIRCRVKVGEEVGNPASEVQLLNLNEFTEEQLHLGCFQISPDHKLVAYTLDTVGNEKYSLFVKDIDTGKVVEEAKEVCSDVIWSSDSTSLFYLTQDEIFRAYRLYYHQLNASQASDQLLYEEKDPKFSLDIIQSVSKKFLFMETAKSTSSEVHFINLAEPKPKLICFSPRAEDRLYSLEHQEDSFIIITNRINQNKFINFYCLKAPITSELSDETTWKELLPYNENHFITGAYPLQNFLLLEERIDGYANLRVVENSNRNYLVKFPEPIFVSDVSKSHLCYEVPELVYDYSSLTTPHTLFKLNLTDNTQTTLKVDPVLGDFDSKLYRSELTVTSEKVPISIVYRKDLLKKDGTNPLHLYGYGSYGYSMDPNFNSSIISLLDRGFVYAIAHVRGGSEVGRQWYELEGKLLEKKNTFRDFDSAAQHLIESRWTSSSILSIEGRSAGGLLVGATINRNPTLFNAAIAGVPFVDVINTMMDDTIPLTINEYEEWGDPNDQKYFNYMNAYSPYDNLPSPLPPFPHMLVRSGLHDPRVQYWEPAKYVAKLRDLIRTSSNHSRSPLVAHLIKMGAGHFGATGRYVRYRDIAQDFAFLIATAQRLPPFSSSPTKL